MMDGNPGCRTDGSGVNPDKKKKKSVFGILLPMVSAQNCAIDGLQESVMKCQKAVILPGSSRGLHSKARGVQTKGLVHTDAGGFYNLHARETQLKLIFKEAW